jgi:RNA polymerase sigma-70 factor (ECF subfamily)
VDDHDAFRDLIRRVRAGDAAAAEELVRGYEGAIRRAVRIHLRTKLRRSLDSMDICQSVLANFFVRAAAGQFNLEDPTHLLKLLVTMARNRLTGHARKPANRGAEVGETLLLETTPGREETPSQQLANQELLARVRAGLSEEERYLADQRALGREWANLAAEQGTSAEALRKKFGRAIDRVTAELGLDHL